MDCNSQKLAASHSKQPICPCMPVLAMAYVPMQEWETPYELEVGFQQGTIFPSLNKPFLEGACFCG